MYALIIAIHVIFVGISHMLGYRIFEGLFSLLGIFFLFYFSPLFFMDKEDESAQDLSFPSFSDILSRFSPKTSLLLPLFLLYIALYGFLFSIFGINNGILFLHSVIIISIFLLFLGYAMSFNWKHDIFFEAFRFHSLFTLISTIIIALSFITGFLPYSWINTLVSIMWVAAGTFLLQYSQKESRIFLSHYLFGIYAALIMIVYFIVPNMGIFENVLIFFLAAFSMFEYFPKYHIYAPYTSFIRYFSLITVFFCIPAIIFLTLSSLWESIFLLTLLFVFFLSIHIRFMNYITYGISILSLFFIYSLLFFGLLKNAAIFPVFLFIFFLPTLLISLTYFWKEKYSYDFQILHYSAIVFSIVYSIYSIFFIGWWADLLFVISLCIFGVAILLFLSYFRFRTSKMHS